MRVHRVSQPRLRWHGLSACIGVHLWFQFLALFIPKRASRSTWHGDPRATPRAARTAHTAAKKMEPQMHTDAHGCTRMHTDKDPGSYEVPRILIRVTPPPSVFIHKESQKKSPSRCRRKQTKHVAETEPTAIGPVLSACFACIPWYLRKTFLLHARRTLVNRINPFNMPVRSAL